MDLNTILLIGILLLMIWLMTTKPAHYPPGPPKWPIIGNIFQMRAKGQIHTAMEILHKKYGEVVGMFAGNVPIILVSGVDAIREVTSREDLSNRPPSSFIKRANNGHVYGIINQGGEDWKIQRRFTLKHLRDLGFGKRTLEGIAHEEVQAVFEDIDRLSGGPDKNYAKSVCLHDILGGASINVLWHIISGQRYDHGDPDFQNLIKCVKNFIQNREPGGILVALPLFTKLFPSLSKMKVLMAYRKPLFNFIKNQIAYHEKTIDYENPRDFLDIYLTEIEKEKINPDSSFHVNQLIQICIELFLAGTDTTLNTLSFAILYMILYPDVQRKIQKSLDEVVGKEKLPSLMDRAKLPYIEAAINEAHRLASIVPLSLPHSPIASEKEISFRGYKIPKGTRVFINLFGMHRDPKFWDEPSKFKPERFLDESEKVINKEAFMPFGAGKRVCLGESLARNNLFLIFTALLQRYTFKVPDCHPEPQVIHEGHAILFPKMYEVKVNIRK